VGSGDTGTYVYPGYDQIEIPSPVGQTRGQLCGLNEVEVEASASQRVSTLQVVEKQDVVGTLSDIVPVAQNTSQFVTGVPVLQGADVILG
jgi:hypothetical protein